jgi:palmitoyltransferase ZDHHC13/17
MNLFVATQRGRLDIVMELIDSKKHSVTEFDEQQTTALHWAAINNHINIAQFLLDRGAVVDQEGGMYFDFF